MTIPVRYLPNGDNSVLLLGLHQSWRGRCYICRRPKDYTDSQIDHIIPRGLSPEILRKRLAEHTPAGDETYDVDAVENLAPICASCNREKSNHDLLSAASMTLLLEKARSKAPTVRDFVRSSRSANVVAKAMIAASTADLREPKSKNALLRFGPTVLERLVALDPSVLDERIDEVLVDDPDDPDARMHKVSVLLDGVGRRARIVLEDSYDLDFVDSLRGPLRAVKATLGEQVTADVADDFEARGHYDPVVGPGQGSAFIEITRLFLDKDDPADKHVRMGGRFEVLMSCSVAIMSDDGSEMVESQGDTLAHGTFESIFWPDSSASPGDVWIHNWTRGAATW